MTNISPPNFLKINDTIMSYDALKKYLFQQMKMSHVYQPIILKRLLIVHGSINIEEIAINLSLKYLKNVE